MTTTATFNGPAFDGLAFDGPGTAPAAAGASFPYVDPDAGSLIAGGFADPDAGSIIPVAGVGVPEVDPDAGTLITQ